MSVLKYKDPATGETKTVGAGISSDAGRITEGTLSADRLPTVPIEKGGTGATTAAAALNNLGAAGKSTAVAATLSAANWTGTEAPFAYTLTLNGVTATSNQEFLPALNITAEQLEALQSANLQDGGQSAGIVILKAFGEVPTVDIPIRIILRGDA